MGTIDIKENDTYRQFQFIFLFSRIDEVDVDW